MSTFWTTVVVLVVAAPIVLAGFVLVRWFGSARQRH